MTATRHRLFNVNEYHQMAERGIFHPEERVELLEGEIISMAAQKPPHASVTNAVADYLKALFADIAQIRVQSPLQLSDRSEPEPDIAVVKFEDNNYFDRHPTTDDTYLVIEVSDTTLRYDTTKKAAAYAKSGIQNYWVVNAIARQIFLYSFPKNNRYSVKTVANAEAVLNIAAFPDISIETGRFFP